MVGWTQPDARPDDCFDKCSELGEALAGIIAAGAKQGEYCNSCRASEGQRVSRRPVFKYHISFNGAPAPEPFCQHRRDALAHAAEQHAGAPNVIPMIALTPAQKAC